MRILLVTALAMILSTTSAWAQSLKPEAPAPLQAGINKSTVDNMIGTQYWQFTGGPGVTHVYVRFTPMTLLGNPTPASVTFTLYDAERTWRTPKVLSSDQKPVEYTFTGQLKNPTKLILSVAPPAGGLVRIGGDYLVEATGAVSFAPPSNADPIIGMYKEMTGYTADLGDCNFLADGTIQSTSGASGNWKLFDKSSQTYVINITGQDRHSLQLMPGRGLVEGDSVVFQQVR